MFCTSLRRRSSAAPLISTLTLPTPAGLQLIESDLRTHDIAIPISNSKRLLFLIVTPPCVISTSLLDTLKRIEHFASLTGGKNCAVLCMLSTSSTKDNTEASSSTTAALAAYAHLTSTLLFGAPRSQGEPSASFTPLVHLPILPVPLASSIPDIVRAYRQIVTAPLPNPSTYSEPNTPPSASRPGKRKPTHAFELLPYCTVTPPLAEDAAIALTDAYVDLKDLIHGAMSTAEEDSTSESMQGITGRLEEVLGAQGAQDVRDFWREEWVAE
ncbi:hypothetical protein EJ05DRAFT_512236 [Pseudovirgaria hyperparasitica]|uniref:Uncharacterized protein n=1 Tax=Pseudovirgaria hyperparasitica TaxID=470096 RepID=A0A6A6W216_9PEZI|nr:uncharacterized protein EJ05DRAFT_512236 [Pseudovirgaria hyperparasitica]KAF2756603.1 hypothetical protein EJ05DRAFT_512236 [Pseudovirgaria hyperparasitica]